MPDFESTFVKFLSTIICEKLIDIGIIKSWYYNGKFVIKYHGDCFELIVRKMENKG